MLTAFVTHLWINPAPPTRMTPSTLFQPAIIKSRNSLMDCDFNIHKSNSTYFTDLDVARAHLVPLLCGRGIAQMRKKFAADGDKGRLGIILGGVHCSFRREIKPLQAFEIWSRLLTWDRKWIYVVNHFVEKGAVQPKGFTLQPWRKTSKGEGKGNRQETQVKNTAANGNEPVATKPKIFASSIAKYVFKAGRRTIPPTQMLEVGGLVPPRPSNIDTPSYPSTPSNVPDSVSREPALAEMVQSLSSASTDEIVEASLRPGNAEEDVWDWQRIEDERVRGMRIAELFNGLDALEDEFRGENDMALGVYIDPA